MLKKYSPVVLQKINMIARQLLLLFKKSTTFWDNPRTCKISTSSHKPFSHNASQISTWLAAEVIKKLMLTEHFKQRAVIKFCANSETWTFLENITVGKRVLDRSFLTGTSDFGKVERTSATIS